MILEKGIEGWLVSRNIFLVLSFWKEVLLIGLAGLVSGSGGGTVCKRLSRPKQGSTVSNKHQQQRALDQTPDPQTFKASTWREPSLLGVTLENYKLQSSGFVRPEFGLAQCW